MCGTVYRLYTKLCQSIARFGLLLVTHLLHAMLSLMIGNLSNIKRKSEYNIHLQSLVGVNVSTVIKKSVFLELDIIFWHPNRSVFTQICVKQGVKCLLKAGYCLIQVKSITEFAFMNIFAWLLTPGGCSIQTTANSGETVLKKSVYELVVKFQN